MQNKLTAVFSQREFLFPLILFILFLSASLPGITWGAPALWNPDELVWRVDMALNGAMQFDVTEPDFNYPSLPKYVMYFIGSITYGLGRSSFAFIVAARCFSAFLGAVVAALIYLIARRIGAGKGVSMLAGLLYIVSGVAAANGRFAHNDLYLQFFCVLCLYFVILFQYSGKTDWLYASFLAVGMAASSKYTGASLVLLPIIVFLFMNWNRARRSPLGTLQILTFGAVLVVLGYGIGTPRLFTSPADYLSKAIPAALRFSQYGFNLGTPPGLYGQWAVFKEAAGGFAYYLMLIAFAWYAVRLILHGLKIAQSSGTMIPGILILVINAAIFDLPFLVSINYIPRHFIPFVPVLAILSALFLDEVHSLASSRKWSFIPPLILSTTAIGVAYSALRLVSVALLFMNDARIPAGEYLANIKGYQTSLEYTLYPPNIEKGRFMRAHNYPIYFVKYENEIVPTGGRYEYNQGEQGLLDRNTDYFVIDSLTYGRFYSDSVCATNPVECDFFKRLIAGEVKSFRLVKKYAYSLPPWLPQLSVAAVNPDILIFARVRE
jgi:4-amino-4-deoxy-L-arabinose transferase-like glycosyltransferase